MMRIGMAALFLGMVVAVPGCQSSVDAPASMGAGHRESGTASEAEVDRRLVEVLETYDEPLTEERRHQALSLLGELTSDSDCQPCDQLAILERMLDLPGGNGDLSFENAARFAAAELIRDRLNEDRS